MPSFPKLQRNITYKNYLIDITIPFIIVIFSSSFILFPLFIGTIITLKFRLLFLINFLIFTEISHNYPLFLLLLFTIIYQKYIYPFLELKIDKQYIKYFSIILIYILFFSFLSSFLMIISIPFSFNWNYIFYYILVESLILKVLKCD
jgi:hypothetical protein